MLLEELLNPIVAEKKQLGVSKAVILNYLKEYIQYLVLILNIKNLFSKAALVSEFVMVYPGFLRI